MVLCVLTNFILRKGSRSTDSEYSHEQTSHLDKSKLKIPGKNCKIFKSRSPYLESSRINQRQENSDIFQGSITNYRTDLKFLAYSHRGIQYILQVGGLSPDI